MLNCKQQKEDINLVMQSKDEMPKICVCVGLPQKTPKKAYTTMNLCRYKSIYIYKQSMYIAK